MNEEAYNAIETDKFTERAYGCILGAFIGDACGSYNEFNRFILSEEKMDECMQMPGGGPFKLASGQITDDSELAMCLMWGLIEGNKIRNEEYNLIDNMSIAKYY